MSKLGFIGFGNMATAIATGILEKGILTASDLTLYDINGEKMATLAAAGATVAGSALDVATNCDYVVLSVKPQNFPELLPQLKPAADAHTVFISIAAGITAKSIQAELGPQAKVVVVMPNTPILVGKGTAALSYTAPTTADEFSYALRLFQAAGEACEIPNSLMNEVIPLNGSSPAFIYYITKVFVDKAVAQGFDADTANRLFCTTLVGAAEMMLKSGMDHQALIDMVSSKGGATIAGLEAMKREGLTEALEAGIDACIARAYELGKK